MKTSIDQNQQAVFFCGDYTRFGTESEKAFQVCDAGTGACKVWMPKSKARKISSRDVNKITSKPVSETMLENSLGVFVIAPLWLGDQKGFEYVGPCAENYETFLRN